MKRVGRRYRRERKETRRRSNAKAKQGQAWSQNKGERQALLQKRREDMILAARRKMEAKLAAESGQGKSAGT
jgi:coupling of ubiquitin conjugation to ER degradation protein 1